MTKLFNGKMNNKIMKRSNAKTAAMRRGQAMTEYIIVFTAMLVAVFAVFYLIHATKRACKRTVTMVASDFP